MASQKELIAIVAEVMSVPIETVTVIDRWLADQGLRTKAKGGRGYTPMTYADAANLIIATAWNVPPKDAVNTVRAYRGLKAQRVRETMSVDDDALGATFGEALENSLEAVPSHKDQFNLLDDDPAYMAMTVTMFGPVHRAEICLVTEGRTHTFQYGDIFAGVGDLARMVRFSQITLGFVGEAIASDLDK